jgi:hypothetical protein
MQHSIFHHAIVCVRNFIKNERPENFYAHNFKFIYFFPFVRKTLLLLSWSASEMSEMGFDVFLFILIGKYIAQVKCVETIQMTRGTLRVTHVVPIFFIQRPNRKLMDFTVGRWMDFTHNDIDCSLKANNSST